MVATTTTLVTTSTTSTATAVSRSRTVRRGAGGSVRAGSTAAPRVACMSPRYRPAPPRPGYDEDTPPPFSAIMHNWPLCRPGERRLLHDRRRRRALATFFALLARHAQ